MRPASHRGVDTGTFSPPISSAKIRRCQLVEDAEELEDARKVPMVPRGRLEPAGGAPFMVPGDPQAQLDMVCSVHTCSS